MTETGAGTGKGDDGKIGILSGRFVPGTLRVDAAALAGRLGKRAPRGLKEIRVTDADETEATLAWDAMTQVLQDAQVQRDAPSSLLVASADAEDTSRLLVEALGRDDLEVQTFTGTPEAAVQAMIAGMEACKHQAGPALVVTTQDTTGLPGPQRVRLDFEGAGAGVLLIGPDAPVLFQGHAQLQHPEGRHPIEELLQRVAPSGATDEVHPMALATREPAQHQRLAQGHQRVTEFPQERLGDLGPAAPVAALLEGLGESEPGNMLDLVTPGTSRSSVIRFQVQETPRVVSLTRSLEDAGQATDPSTAMRIKTTWIEQGTREPRGAYVPPATFHAHDAARLRFQGQHCDDCNKSLFPPRERCPGCGTADLKPLVFSGEGTVHAVTRISTGGAPAEFSPMQDAKGPYGVAIVELKEGPRVAAMLTGPKSDGAQVRIDDPVRLVVRLLYVQDGVPRYSFKAFAMEPPEEE